MVAIKLRPVGKKRQRSYRVVVQKKRSKLDGRYIEDLGFYNPRTDDFQINQHRAEYWISVGAQPTDTVHNLFVTANVIDAPKRAVHAKSKGVEGEEASAGESAPAESAPAEDADDGAEDTSNSESAPETESDDVSEEGGESSDDAATETEAEEEKSGS